MSRDCTIQNKLVLEEALETVPTFKEPSLYKIVMHNDDFTTMEFVVAVLEMFFHMERLIATRIMYEIHHTGKAICGIYSRDVAETKVDQVKEHARRHEYPLLCSIESS
jgi:ATP-dependent Clp protease adaptor protein ClpS